VFSGTGADLQHSSVGGVLPQVLEDVSEEHARKTITLDPHPHLAVSAASIHPCRHAEVMKKLADNISSDGREFPLEQ
jgi:ubiquitin-like-conjugating enzyme ATG3